MSTNERQDQPGAPKMAQGPGVVAHGWLAADSVFEHTDSRKLGPAMWTSFGTHAAMLGVLMLAVLFRPEHVSEPLPVPDYDIVFVHSAGPGGGGGGNPTPAPPQPEPLEIPKPKVEEIPLTPPPEEVKLADPVEPPKITAPIYTNAAEVLRSSGSSAISLSPFGGTGQGTGIGPGRGRGVGPGEEAGFGGGAYRPGSGVTDPTLLRQEAPKYTSDAMRAKIQGIVELEAVVLPNGTVGDVRVTKSLDARYGLDQEAIRAATKWLFQPGTLEGEPVPVLVTLILEFRLH